jgi:hypothetical protein
MIKKSSCESEAVPFVLKFRIKLWTIIINFKRMKIPLKPLTQKSISPIKENLHYNLLISKLRKLKINQLML